MSTRWLSRWGRPITSVVGVWSIFLGMALWVRGVSRPAACTGGCGPAAEVVRVFDELIATWVPGALIPGGDEP
jgi:hypothetical protein